LEVKENAYMNTGEWMLVIIALVGAVVNYLQQREQNQIFREQNRIFADQGGKIMLPEKSRFIWLKRYWPTLITILLFLLIGYDIYARHLAPIVPWWFYALLLVIVTAIGLVIGRLAVATPEPLDKTIDRIVATLPQTALTTEKSKDPSKLVIHWANYQAADNAGGEVFQVADFLRQIISGDSLVFDIENHNFVIGDKNFVPRDPLVGKIKRLQVNYSYAGGTPVTTERREHGRLLLPEDSKISWLMDQVNQLKALQPALSPYPIPDLRLKVLSVVSELQGFLGLHGQAPKVERQQSESQEEFQQRWRSIVMPWRAKFIGDYSVKFGDALPHLRDEIRLRAHIDNYVLNAAIEKAANDPNGNIKGVEDVIKQLWDMALGINI